MSSAYEEVGRTRQKSRTRAALVAATRELLAAGTTPTVEQAAERAGISRTTAYRYFPSQLTLLAAAHPTMVSTSLLPDRPPRDPEERLDLAVGALVETTLRDERQQRAMLRLSLQDPPPSSAQLPLRQGRAIGWLEDALSPLEPRLGRAAIRRLAIAVRSACGLESLIWLIDVGGLSREDAAELVRGTARALLRAALADARAGRTARRGKKRR